MHRTTLILCSCLVSSGIPLAELPAASSVTAESVRQLVENGLSEEQYSIARYMAEKIPGLVAEVDKDTSKRWSAEDILDAIEERTTATFRTDFEKLNPDECIKVTRQILEKLKEGILAETTPTGRRDKLLSLLKNEVQPGLRQAGTPRASAAAANGFTEAKVVAMFGKIHSGGKDEAREIVKRLIPQIKALARDLDDGNGGVTTAISRIRTEVMGISDVTQNEALKGDLRVFRDALLKELEKSKTPSDVSRLIESVVVPGLVTVSEDPTLIAANTPASSFGLTEVVLQKAKARKYIIELDLDRDKTAMLISEAYTTHAGQVGAEEKPLDYAFEVENEIQQIAASTEFQSANRTFSPWKSLLIDLRNARNRLQKQGKLHRHNGGDWSIVFGELAKGFQQLSEQYGGSRELTDEWRQQAAQQPKGTSSPSGSHCGGCCNKCCLDCSKLGAESLERALKYRRKEIEYERKLRKLPQW